VPPDPPSSDTASTTLRFGVPGGINVVADVGGDPDAPVVVLMHGGGQTRHSWHEAMRELVRAGFHVVNLDARGHGDSGWSPDGNYSLATMAEDLRTIVGQLRSTPMLVGASMGAATALYAAGHWGSEVARAIVLVDLVPRIDETGANKIKAFMRANPQGFATVDEAADAVAAYYPHRARPKDTSGLMKNLRQRADGRLHWHWDPAFISGRLNAEPPVFRKLLLEATAQVRVPTLLVRGMQSDIVTDEGVNEFRQALPSLEVVDVVGAGHMVAGDKNDIFNHAVISFLRRVMAAGANSRA